MLTALKLNGLSFGLDTANMNCAVKSSAVPKVPHSRYFNCTNVRIFQLSLDLTAQLKLKIKLYVCGGSSSRVKRSWGLISQEVCLLVSIHRT